MILARVLAKGEPRAVLTLRVTPSGQIWSGSLGELESWARTEADSALGLALGRVVRSFAPPPLLELGSRRFEFGRRTWLMGVVNVTPDSFSDGGRFFDQQAAISHGVGLVAAGADLLDVGGESTRPGASAVGVDEELRRVLGVIGGLRAACPLIPISVDTSKAEVARRAVEAGASMINDVTALAGDSQMAEVAAATGAGLCLMHMKGTPRTMQQDPRYEDLVAEVLEALEIAANRALAAGVKREKLVVDPGIGFGKTVDHNLTLLRQLNDFRLLGYPVLVGTSRKSFLGQLTGRPPAERVVASAATVALVAAAGSADFARVHDVAEARDAAAVGEGVRFGYRPAQ
jgi:dihydropteroate synthase